MTNPFNPNEIRELHRDDDWYEGKDTTHIGYEQDVRDLALAERILAMPVGADTRSSLKWFRLANGGLILGVYPCGDAYFETEGERTI